MAIFLSIIVAVAISAFTFVLEEVIRNFAAGFFIRREKRFVAGNIVAVDEIGELQIVQIGTMSTLAVETETGLYTALNNSTLLQATVRNFSRTDWYYAKTEILVARDTDLVALEEAVFTFVEDLEWSVFGKEPKFELERFTQDVLVIEIKVAVKPTKPRHEWQSMLRKALLNGLSQSGFQILGAEKAEA